MGRDRDSPGSGLPEAFNDPGRSLTPHSARRIVTSGASEIVVDDFINAYLKERPKTIPEMALYQPPEPAPAPPPPAPTAPAGRIYQRQPNRAVPAPAPSQPILEADREPVTTPRGAALVRPSTDESQTKQLLADKDRRISQLEDELTRVKDELLKSQRTSSPGDPEPATKIARSPLASQSSDEPRTVFRPAAPPRPGAAPKLAPMVKTVPMVAMMAPSSPPPAQTNDATMMLPSVEPEEPSDKTMMLQSVGPLAPAPAPAPPPSTPPEASAPTAGFAGTMVMQVGPAIAGIPSSSQFPAPPSSAEHHSAAGGPTQGLSGLTPAPFFTPIESTPPPQISPYVAPPESESLIHPPQRRGGAGKWVALALLVAVVGGASFAYLRRVGPMAELRNRIEGAKLATNEKHEPVAPKAAATGAPKEPAKADAPTSIPTASAETSPTPTTAAPTSTALSPHDAPKSDAPPVVPATPEELKALLSFQAYLTVRSSAQANVVAQGQDVGKTNQRLVVRCGPRNVRLRGPDAHWLSDGMPVHIDCMQHTIVDIEPTH